MRLSPGGARLRQRHDQHQEKQGDDESLSSTPNERIASLGGMLATVLV